MNQALPRLAPRRKKERATRVSEVVPLSRFEAPVGRPLKGICVHRISPTRFVKLPPRVAFSGRRLGCLPHVSVARVTGRARHLVGVPDLPHQQYQFVADGIAPLNPGPEPVNAVLDCLRWLKGDLLLLRALHRVGPRLLSNSQSRRLAFARRRRWFLLLLLLVIVGRPTESRSGKERFPRAASLVGLVVLLRLLDSVSSATPKAALALKPRISRRISLAAFEPLDAKNSSALSTPIPSIEYFEECFRSLLSPVHLLQCVCMYMMYVSMYIY